MLGSAAFAPCRDPAGNSLIRSQNYLHRGFGTGLANGMAEDASKPLPHCRPPRRRRQRGNPVKKIEAIIKPFKLDEVKEALQEWGIRA